MQNGLGVQVYPWSFRLQSNEAVLGLSGTKNEFPVRHQLLEAIRKIWRSYLYFTMLHRELWRADRYAIPDVNGNKHTNIHVVGMIDKSDSATGFRNFNGGRMVVHPTLKLQTMYTRPRNSIYLIIVYFSRCIWDQSFTESFLL